MPSDMEPETSIRQNITARAVGFGAGVKRRNRISIGSTHGTRESRRSASSNSPRSTCRRSTSSPVAARRATSCSRACTSGGLGRRRPIRRAIDWRMVRDMSTWDGVPSTLMPARAGAIASVATTWLFTRSGSSRSSKNRSRNSSRLSTKRKPSCASPSPWPAPLPPPPPLPPGGRLIRSPLENSLLPDRTRSRWPPVNTVWKDGSCSTSAGMVTASPCPVSRSVP